MTQPISISARLQSNEGIIATAWIIDQHPIARAGLKGQLEAHGIAVSAEGATIADVWPKAQKGQMPSLIVLDLNLGIEQIGELKSRCPDSYVVAFADHAELSALSQAFAAGADGYVLKSISAAALIESLKLVLHGEKVFPSIVTSFLSTLKGNALASTHAGCRYGDVDLTEREVAIVRGLAQGQTNKSIANALHVTEATVKVNLKAILRKLGFTNRTQVAIWAIHHHITQPLTAEDAKQPSERLNGKTQLVS